MFNIKANPANRKVELSIRNNVKASVRGIRQGFYFLGRDLRATANKNILATPRFGRLEIFKGKRRRASVPGESFANRTGDARKQLGFFVKGGDQLEFGFRADAETLYTKTLEEDLNRPTLTIAVKSNNKNAKEHFDREIKRAHKEGFK